jgi:Uma2 family endonuclease
MATELIDQPKIEPIEMPVEGLVEMPVASSSETRVASRVETPVAIHALIERRHRITVAEYRRMRDAGVFGHSSRMELLEGVIVAKMTKNTPHIIATDKIEDLLHFVFPRGSAYCITMGNPLTIEDRDGEPEPDAMVLRGSIDDYLDRPRVPADVPLLIEVSDSSYDYDRYAKWTSYAAARVPIYWIVDVNHDRLEVHTEPSGQGESAFYARSSIYDQLDEPVPLTLDGRVVIEFPLREILPVRKQASEPRPPAQPQ